MHPKLGRPFRAKLSPGVGGVLEATAQVVYHMISSGVHSGRIGDVIVAQLKQQDGVLKTGWDEARFRALLLFGVFLGEVEDSKRSSVSEFLEPLVLEVGQDDERIAISFAFGLSKSEVNSVEKDFKNTRFEKLFDAVRGIGDATLVKINRDQYRAELVAILSLGREGVISRSEAISNFEWIEIDSKTNTGAAAVEKYTELGDLPHENLLSFEDSNRLISSEGEAVKEIDGRNTREKKTKKRMSIFAGLLKSVGTKQEEEEEDDIKIFEGSGEDVYSKEKWNVKAPLDQSDVQKGAADEKLVKRIKELEEILAAQAVAMQKNGRIKKDAAVDVEEVSTKFKPNDQEDAADENGKTEDAPIKDDLSDEIEKEVMPLDTEKLTSLESALAIETTEKIENLEKEVKRGGLAKRLDRAKEEYSGLSSEISSVRAKAWTDSLISDLHDERNRVQELVGQLSSTVKQKESEFHNAEKRLLQEIKMRDESLKQKTTALSRAKDQIAQLQLRLDEAKSGAAAAKEDKAFKTKYDVIQKLLADEKRTSADFQRQMDEMKQQMFKMKSATNSLEMVETKQKLERSLKQIEDLRKINQQLSERGGGSLSSGLELKRGGSVQVMEEMKKKVEQAQKQTSKLQSQNEQLQIKLEEHQREEGRLKKESLALQAELRRLSAAQKGQGGAGGKPSAA